MNIDRSWMTAFRFAGIDRFRAMSDRLLSWKSIIFMEIENINHSVGHSEHWMIGINIDSMDDGWMIDQNAITNGYRWWWNFTTSFQRYLPSMKSSTLGYQISSGQSANPTWYNWNVCRLRGDGWTQDEIWCLVQFIFHSQQWVGDIIMVKPSALVTGYHLLWVSHGFSNLWNSAGRQLFQTFWFTVSSVTSRRKMS